MFIEFFKKYPKYKILEHPSEETINSFKNILPDQLIQFWIKYGFGEFMDGYLKIVNPNDYQGVLNDAYNNSDNEIVFGITALGDFMCWDKDAINLVKFRYGNYNIIESGDDMEWFFNSDLAEDFFVKEELLAKNYSSAKEKLGDLEFDECFGYVPLLGIGGSEKAENLQKVKIKEHISIIAQMMGKIE